MGQRVLLGYGYRFGYWKKPGDWVRPKLTYYAPIHPCGRVTSPMPGGMYVCMLPK